MLDANLEHIKMIIEKPLNDLGYDLVRVLISGKIRLKLQVMIDRLDETPLTMNDCVKASRNISSLMDVEDPIEASYNLEVSSPGQDRPLTRLKDFRRYLKSKIKLETFDSIDGQKRFQGILQAVENEDIILGIESDNRSIQISVNQIKKAHLIPDFLIPSKGQKQKRER